MSACSEIQQLKESIEILTLGLNAANLAIAQITPSTNTATADNSFLAKADVSGDGNQPNNILTLTSSRTDAGWAIAGNQATYTGAPDKVRIDAGTWYEQPQSGTLVRISPVLELLRNGTVVGRSDSGYQRHSANHNSSSNTIAWTDDNPGTNPVYQLRAQQGSNQNDVMNVDLGHFSLDAVEKVTVLVS